VPHVRVEVLGPVRAAVDDAEARLGGRLGRGARGLATGRAMPNFTPDGAPNSVCYPAETLQRLRRIKLERDPQGTIRSNKPVLGD
jgi:hypothetical protein